MEKNRPEVTKSKLAFMTSTPWEHTVIWRKGKEVSALDIRRNLDYSVVFQAWQ